MKTTTENLGIEIGSSSKGELNRRDFLKVSGLAGAGLIISIGLLDSRIAIGYSTFTLYDNLVRQSFAASAASLSNPTSKTWATAYLSFNAGVGFERKFRIWMYDFSAGLSGGYRATLSTFIESNNFNLAPAPVSLSGFEFNFKIRVEFRTLRKTTNKSLFEKAK